MAEALCYDSPGDIGTGVSYCIECIKTGEMKRIAM